MAQPIGVGLVGYGLGGRAFHAPYVREDPALDLRAVVSRDPAKVARDLSEVRVVSSIEALLTEPGIDLVIVSSPDALHAEHALAAIDAGKHVLIDKPFATTLDDARAIAARAADRGRLLTVFHNRRWDADFLTLRRLIADDVLGDIVTFESRFDRWRPVVTATWKDARTGGSWFDLGPHLVDQALCLFGLPEDVTADFAALRGGAAATDYFHVVLRYPRRRVVLQSSKLAAAHGLRFAVHGTRASWTKHGIDPQEAQTVGGSRPRDEAWGVDPTPGVLTKGDGSTDVVASERGDYRIFWRALAAAIRGDGPNPVPPDQALSVMTVIDAAISSAATGRTVHLTRSKIKENS